MQARDSRPYDSPLPSRPRPFETALWLRRTPDIRHRPVFRPAARAGLARFAPNKNLRRLQTCEIGPCNEPARGTPVFSGLVFLIPLKGRAEHRAFHRARGATRVTTWHHVLSRHMTPCPVGTAHGKQQPQTQCIRLRSARDGFDRLATPSGTTTPGALTECWASPHCWVLGPPTPSAGHRPFTTSQPARFNGAPSHERPTDATGPSHPAPAPVMLPARLFVGAGQPINIPRNRTGQGLFFWKPEIIFNIHRVPCRWIPGSRFARPE